MGYTHYWRRKPTLDSNNFLDFSKDIIKIVQGVGMLLAYEYDEPTRPPQIDGDLIRFNGVGKDGHETFYFEREANTKYQKPGENEIFSFCKTAQKPYDLMVTAALIAAKHHFGIDIKVSSDGEDTDWEPTRKLCQNALGYGDKFHITVNQNRDRYLEEV
jgi:hypothetical protein